MRKLFLFLSLGIFLFSCKEAKKETKPSPYQSLADQYAEFPLTTDLNQLTENEKKMLPLLIEVADIMEDIFWQNAYGDKSALMAQFAQDSAALKYLSINYGCLLYTSHQLRLLLPATGLTIFTQCSFGLIFI